MELQADCLAGVWASLNDQVKNRLQPGDIEEGLKAAAAIGDDTLQRQTQGRVVPESFTHGTSAQRVRWFRRASKPARRRPATPSMPAISSHARDTVRVPRALGLTVGR